MDTRVVWTITALALFLELRMVVSFVKPFMLRRHQIVQPLRMGAAVK